MQGGHHPKLGDRLVSRSAPSHPRKISAHQHPRIQPAGVPPFRETFRMPLREVISAIQGGRARLDSRRRRRNSGGSRAAADFAAQMQERPVAGGDAGGARARIEIERDDDVRPRRDDRGSHRTSAAAARSAGRERRVHRVHLLDVSAGAHGAESRRSRPASPEYLRTQALARIFLDNFPNIQSSWVTQGPEIGQIALKYGANDFGTVMMEENVVSRPARLSDSTPTKSKR